MLQRAMGGTQTTHKRLGTWRTGLVCLLGSGTRQADVNSGSEGTACPFLTMESTGGPSLGFRDMGGMCPCGLCDLNSCPPFSEPQPLLKINMARAGVGSPVPGLCSNSFAVTPTLC